jgi:hypothetical protein
VIYGLCETIPCKNRLDRTDKVPQNIKFRSSYLPLCSLSVGPECELSHGAVSARRLSRTEEK